MGEAAVLWQAAAGVASHPYPVDTVAQRRNEVAVVPTFESFAAAAALLLAAAAIIRARRISRRLDRLTESYWDLRYEYGQLRSRVARLEGQPESEAPPVPTQGRSTSFVPLSSLKR